MTLPQRKPQRLKGYNYSQNGCYFLTICTQNRACLFGKVSDGEMEPNRFGIVMQENIKKIDSLYDNVCVDIFIVMPNHIHAIVTIRNENVESITGQARSKERLSKIVQSFKAAVTKEIRKMVETESTTFITDNEVFGMYPIPSDGKIWQKSFHDHIIRNEKEYLEIWQYIESNAQKWDTDCFRKM